MNRSLRRRAFTALSFVYCLIFGPNYSAAETRRASAASYVELGDKWANLGEFKRAIKTYNLALQFSPDFAVAYFKRGCARRALGDFSEAIADFSKNLEIAPRSAEVYANRAYVRALKQEDDK